MLSSSVDAKSLFRAEGGFAVGTLEFQVSSLTGGWYDPFRVVT